MSASPGDGGELLLSCAGLLFDCDGVLVDSGAGVESAWSRWARHYGLEPADVLAVVHGRRAADTVAALLPEEQRAEAVALVDAFELADVHLTGAVPGSPELTAALPADRWAVVTSGTSALSRARLTAAGVGAPAVLVAASDVQRGKPDPEGYLAAAARLGFDPAVLVVLEDVPPGVAAARAAGVRAVVGVGASALATDADLVVADLRALRWDGAGLRVPAGAALRAPSALLLPAG